MLEMLWKIDSNRRLAAQTPKLKPEGLRKVCASRAPNSQTRRNTDQKIIRMWLNFTNNNIETNETHRQMIKGCHEEIETEKLWAMGLIKSSIGCLEAKIAARGAAQGLRKQSPKQPNTMKHQSKIFIYGGIL